MKILIALVALSPFTGMAKDTQIVNIHHSAIEALEGKDGNYARFADISEGFVSYEGVIAKEKSLLIDLKKSKINSVILKDGSRLDHALLSTAAAVIGGDMGGGGTAH